MNLHVERLRRLPGRPGETWQGRFVRLPGWVTGEGPRPYRPKVFLWVSLRTGLVHMSEPCRPGKENFAVALNALADFASNAKLAGYRPGKLEVNDPALAEHLSGTLAEAEIRVTDREDLAAVEPVVKDLTRHMIGREPPPGALDAKGVTLEHMRAFADAAREFYEASPWDRLGTEDLIEIEAPQCEPAMKFAVVLGSGRQTYGLGFYRSVDHYWTSQALDDPEQYLESQGGGVWSLTFDDITALPFADADLWEDHGLPVAGADAYPSVIYHRTGDRLERPCGEALCFLEGLLRALAAASEEELDCGRWSTEVRTLDGPATYTLALPFLLKPPGRRELYQHGIRPDRRAMERTMSQVERFLEDKPLEDLDELNELLRREFVGREMDESDYGPRTPLEKAQDICYQAFDAFGRRKISLARQALKVCPDCADAYVILAENAPSPEQALELYKSGVEAGRRALGDEAFEEEPGYFWGFHETRPFMRALFGVALCLQERGQLEQAAERYRELLSLNPDDNQGVRYVLLTLLIKLNRDEDARELLEQYPDEAQAVWPYSRALLAFRSEGDTERSRRLVRKALKANKHVPKYLLGKAVPSHWPDSYGLGNDDEAIVCADELQGAWEETAGALEWLAAQAKPARRRRKKGRKRRKNK